MDLNKRKRKDFTEADSFKWDSPPESFTSLVLIPTRKKHDSGYNMIEAVACNGNEILGKVTLYSDVIHIDGIGGYGEWKAEDGVPTSVIPKGWCIDLLAGSNLFRLFKDRGKLKCGLATSSLEIY